MKKLRFRVLLLGGALAAAPVFAEEAPPSAAVSMEELSQAITDYVAEDAALKGGYFLVYDVVEKKPLMLVLDKVHHDRLARLSDGVYFACADFKNADGTVYDLDVFMKGPSVDRLVTTEITVHKKSGKPRYGWKEVDGNWVKVKD